MTKQPGFEHSRPIFIEYFARETNWMKGLTTNKHLLHQMGLSTNQQKRKLLFAE
jgi:hypothetical protein